MSGLWENIKSHIVESEPELKQEQKDNPIKIDQKNNDNVSDNLTNFFHILETLKNVVTLYKYNTCNMDTEDIKRVKQSIKDAVIFTSINLPSTGGQQVTSSPNPKLRLYSEELDLKIETGYHRSFIKNKELLLKLFEVMLNEVIV